MCGPSPGISQHSLAPGPAAPGKRKKSLIIFQCAEVFSYLVRGCWLRGSMAFGVSTFLSCSVPHRKRDPHHTQELGEQGVKEGPCPRASRIQGWAALWSPVLARMLLFRFSTTSSPGAWLCPTQFRQCPRPQPGATASPSPQQHPRRPPVLVPPPQEPSHSCWGLPRILCFPLKHGG